jgi:transposase
MNEERITETPSWNDPRGQVMKTPDDVAEMLRLRACGWGVKRIARHLGCSHHTVRDYVAAGGVKPFKSPERAKLLDGLEGWLRERFIRHRGNADVVRQDLLAEKGVAVSRRTLQRAVRPYRQALQAEALATTRFETPPGRQLQIDFGERLVEIGGTKIKAFVIVATLGHSRRLHVRAFRAEKQEHCFAGLESAFTTFGGGPEEVLMDNPRALVARHDAVSRSVVFNDKLIAFAKRSSVLAPRAVSGAHEGQDGERRRLREEERGLGLFGTLNEAKRAAGSRAGDGMSGSTLSANGGKERFHRGTVRQRGSRSVEAAREQRTALGIR